MRTAIENLGRLQLFAQNLSTKIPDNIQKPLVAFEGTDGVGNIVSVVAKQVTSAVQLWEVAIHNSQRIPIGRVGLLFANEGGIEEQPGGAIAFVGADSNRFQIGPGLAAAIYYHNNNCIP